MCWKPESSVKPVFEIRNNIDNNPQKYEDFQGIDYRDLN